MDKSLIKELNNEDFIGSSVFLPNISENEKSLDSQCLDEIREYISSKKIFKVQITAVGPDKSLRCPLGNGMLGVIPNTEVYAREMSQNELNRFMGKTVGIVVTHMSENNRIVFMSIVKAKEIVRDYYIKNLKPGDTVTAVVTFVNEKTQRIHIDIDGCGLFGYVPIKQWGYEYIYNPVEQIRKGTIVKVKIEKFYPDIIKGTGFFKHHYRASRQAVLDNPWIGIETLFPVGMELEVTAIHLTNKHNFFASTPLLKNLEVFVEYPENANVKTALNETDEDIDIEIYPKREKIIIRKGEQYRVRIYRSNEKNKDLRARVIKHIERPEASVKASAIQSLR